MHYRPVSPAAVTGHLVGRLQADDPGRTLRVLVDGAPATGPHAVADSLVEPLQAQGRPVLRVRADGFWRDASLRLEWGRHDEESFYRSWLDAAALEREVLEPLGPTGDGQWLPSLRDPVTNRSTRAARRPAPAHAILVVSGSLLLVSPLSADVVVHLTASAAALARRTPATDVWMLPAFARYDRENQPARRSDVVIRVEDPAHPAVALAG